MGRWLKYLATWSNKNFKNVIIFSNDVLFFVFVWTHLFQLTSIKSHQIFNKNTFYSWLNLKYIKFY